MQRFFKVIEANRAGRPRGIYAVCTAHPLVIEAALLQAKQDGAPALIEATANQVNQYGGYTGMQPADYISFIGTIAHRAGFSKEDIILGGDHLGPVCWRNESAGQAMEKSRELVAAYVTAGFKKIHLDTSMACAGDDESLVDDIVAARAADLCEVAEHTAEKLSGQSDLVYVIGTEAPPPGGAMDGVEDLRVTGAEQVKQTVAAHTAAFSSRGLDMAWERVIGLVVQPGVEFDHVSVHDYQRENAAALRDLIAELPYLIYEAHSTDYQCASAYRELVRDHFAILKVGPQLTHAMREALFALSHIEDEQVGASERAGLRGACEIAMLNEPGHWQKYYSADEGPGRLYRRYSYSDRIRYYWNRPAIKQAVDKLFTNLSAIDVPLPLLSQYMPLQYAAVREGTLANNPRAMVLHHIMQVTARYADACWKQEQ